MNNNESSVQIWAEYLYFDGGAKYISINQTGPIVLPPDAPGLERTVLKSSESIKIANVGLVFEYSRFYYNKKFITWLGCYTPSVDRQLGDRRNIDCIGLWVVDGLVNFDPFIEAAPHMLQRLKNAVHLDDDLKALIKTVASTGGEWLPFEQQLGIAWCKELLDQKTAIINKQIDKDGLKRLIKNLSRFGDGIGFYDQLNHCDRIFIHTDGQWNHASTVSGELDVNEEDIAESIVKRAAKWRETDQKRIEELAQQLSVAAQVNQLAQSTSEKLRSENGLLLQKLEDFETHNSPENRLKRWEKFINEFNPQEFELIQKNNSNTLRLQSSLESINVNIDTLNTSINKAISNKESIKNKTIHEPYQDLRQSSEQKNSRSDPSKLQPFLIGLTGSLIGIAAATAVQFLFK